MGRLIHLKKEDQELMPLFNGAFIENKPIPFPNFEGTTAYSNLFYWAHLEAKETSEFPLHPHEGFEIMTFVFKGSVEHFDTASKVWTPLGEGCLQVIQAGSGVKHAERITKGTELFQIWFDPDFSKSLRKDAAYKDYKKTVFKTEEKEGVKTLSYLGENSPVYFETEGVEVSKRSFKPGKHTELLDKNYTYSYYLLDGKMYINDSQLEKDGFMAIDDTEEIEYEVGQDAELFMIKSPTTVEYDRFIQRYN